MDHPLIGEVPEEHLNTFLMVKAVWEKMSPVDLGAFANNEPIPYSCHVVCRAFARVFRLQYADGQMNGADHTWIPLPIQTKTHINRWIIDMVPVGIVSGPMLIAMSGSPYRPLYVVKNIAYPAIPQLHFTSREFRSAICTIEAEIHRTLKALNITLASKRSA